MSGKDIKRLVERVGKLWPVVELGGGRFKIVPPNNQQLIFCNLSDDPRALKNTKAHLRRAGFYAAETATVPIARRGPPPPPPAPAPINKPPEPVISIKMKKVFPREYPPPASLTPAIEASAPAPPPEAVDLHAFPRPPPTEAPEPPASPVPVLEAEVEPEKEPEPEPAPEPAPPAAPPVYLRPAPPRRATVIELPRAPRAAPPPPPSPPPSVEDSVAYARERILDLLRQGRADLREISQRLGIQPQFARSLLVMLDQEGLLNVRAERTLSFPTRNRYVYTLKTSPEAAPPPAEEQEPIVSRTVDDVPEEEAPRRGRPRSSEAAQKVKKILARRRRPMTIRQISEAGDIPLSMAYAGVYSLQETEEIVQVGKEGNAGTWARVGSPAAAYAEDTVHEDDVEYEDEEEEDADVEDEEEEEEMSAANGALEAELEAEGLDDLDRFTILNEKIFRLKTIMAAQAAELKSLEATREVVKTRIKNALAGVG
jgi:hypothetical protein